VPLAVSGSLVTALGTVVFDAVTATINHKPNPGRTNDGCINHLLFQLRQGAGCHLSVAASTTMDVEGRLSIQELTLVSNSLCDAIPAGTYGRTGTSEGSAVVMGMSALPGIMDLNVCFQTDFVLHVDGTLMETVTGVPLAIEPSSIVVTGDYVSTIDGATPCPCTPLCSGGVCGVDNGCGGTCRCLDGEKCGDENVCVNACTADCTGKQCGPDGCGGVCGVCEGDGTCSNGTCMGGGSKPPTEDVSIVKNSGGCRTGPVGNGTGMLPWFPLLLMIVFLWRNRQRMTEEGY